MALKKYIPALLTLLPFPVHAQALTNADLLSPGYGTRILYPAMQKPALRKIIVPVMEDGREVGAAHMTDAMQVDASDLSGWVAANMNDAAVKGFEGISSGGTVTPGTTAPGGFNLAYDAEQSVLQVKPDPAMLKTRQVSFQGGGAEQGQEILKPADLSAFLNFRGAEDYIDTGANTGRMPGRLDLDGAVNMHGWVMEGRSDYLEDDPRPWARDDTRLVHDWPDSMVRAAAGDLSYPVAGFQSFQPMLGVSVARSFDLQPYRITQPAGQDSFVVQTPSTADILVNGQKVRTLHLDPGTYNVTDFPVTDGSNDVKLVITGATGRTEIRDLSLTSDQSLLKQGLHAYAYNVGVESEDEDRNIRYELQRPAASFFHRYGFSDTFTAGFSGQGDENVQQGGLSAVKAFGIGIVGLDVFASDLSGYGPGGAAQLTFSRRDPATQHDFTSSLEYKTEDFASLGQIAPAGDFSWQAAARYSQPVLDGINMGAGGNFRRGEGATKDDWSYGVSFSKTISSSITVSLNGDDRQMQGAGVFLNVTWSPPQSRMSMASTVDTIAGTQAVDWRYRADHALQSWQADAGVTRTDGGEMQATGSAAYSDYRFDASARHDITTGINGQQPQQESEALFGTAIAYADGHAAITRPITGSFVMLAAHDSLQGQDIGINPETAAGPQAGGWQARIDGLGPAVLPDATPYMYRPVKIDTRALPPGYDVGHDIYTAFPSYKSGTVAVVGSAANIFADGHLAFANGAPAALQGGVLNCASDAKIPPQEFFTNADGRFRIAHLAPGAYEMSLYRNPQDKITLVIPKGLKAGRFDAGKRVLQENP